MTFPLLTQGCTKNGTQKAAAESKRKAVDISDIIK